MFGKMVRCEWAWTWARASVWVCACVCVGVWAWAQMKSITFHLEPLAVAEAMKREGTTTLPRRQLHSLGVAAQTAQRAHHTHGRAGTGAATRPPDALHLHIHAEPRGRSWRGGRGCRARQRGEDGAGPVSAAALRLQQTLLPDAASKPEEPCEYRDQYSVGDEQNPKTGCSRFCELFHGVAFSNDVSKRVGTISSLLGPTGHYERMSFWTHFVGAFVFAAYALVRQVLVRDDARLAGGLTSAAAWTISAVFLTSSLYHCTAPDLNFAMVTRVLDYAAIYIGITVTTTADIAVATRGFVHVPAQTIADLPASAVILIIFFVWRRSRLPGESTWTKHEITSRAKDGCLLGRGLCSYGHRDLAHIQMRQSTSLLLFGSYFMVVPAAMDVLGHGVARVVLRCSFARS